jgi:malonyl CoA-acyl carrier protein transacylase
VTDLADLDLTDLQTRITDIAETEMDPTERARQCTRIAYTAVAVAFTQGAITQEVATGLLEALDAVLAELETV